MPSRIVRRSDFVTRIWELVVAQQAGNSVFEVNRPDILPHVKDMATRESALGDVDWLDGFRLDREGAFILYVTSFTAEDWEACKRLSVLADIKVVVQLETSFDGAGANDRYSAHRAAGNGTS